MRLPRHLIFIFFLCAAPCAVVADAGASELLAESLGLKQGLPGEDVVSIVQDRQGFMWFGGQNGLSRYDGYRLTIYRKDSADPFSLSDNLIQTLHVDASGRLWIGSRGGLQRYDYDTGKFISYIPGHQENRGTGYLSVTAIVDDGANGLWVGTEDGLEHLDVESVRFTVMRHDPSNSHSLNQDKINALARDAQGYLWIRTDAGVDRLAPGAGDVEHFPIETVTSPETLQLLLIDHDQNLWINTETGLESHDISDGSFRKNRTVEGHWKKPQQITALLEDHEGNLWIGTYADGLQSLNIAKNSFTSFSSPAGNSPSIANDVAALYQDRNGMLWIGTWSDGVKRANIAHQGFQRFLLVPDDAKDLNANKIFIITPAEDGLLWLHTNAGLKKLNPATGAVADSSIGPQGSFGTFAPQVVVKRDDQLARNWLKTHTDAAALRVNTREFETGDPNSEVIRQIISDHEGNVWIGSHAGLHRVDAKTGAVRTFAHDPFTPESLVDGWVIKILEDRSHRLWVGTRSGLDRFDPITGKFAHYRHDPRNSASISHDQIRWLLEDRKGTIWIATGGGLNRLETGANGEIMFRSYTVKDGLGADPVGAIFEDKAGLLWMSTSAGISRLDPSTGRFRNFTHKDGLIEGYYYYGSAYQARDGTIYFGGITGLTAFKPEQIHESLPPPVVVTNVFVSETHRSQDERVDSSAGILEKKDPTDLILPHPYASVSFEFAALDYADPAANRYAYRLEGLDKDWIYADAGKHIATYGNVEPGHYVFRVKAANKDGVWNESGASVDVRIGHSMWGAPWLWSTVAILLFCAWLARQKLASVVVPALAYWIGRSQRNSSPKNVLSPQADQIDQQEKEALQAVMLTEEASAAGSESPVKPVSQESGAIYLKWITANVGKSLRLIPVEEVVFFQADNKYTRVVMAESEVLVKKSLKELISELDPTHYWRIHRSIVVNAREVLSITPNANGEMSAKLRSRREMLPVSDTFLRKFRHM